MVEWHGDHIGLYREGDDLSAIDFGSASVRDADFPEGKGYFENPRLTSYTSIEGLVEGLQPLAVPTPSFLPTGYRFLAATTITSLSGVPSDFAMVWIESGITQQELAFGVRDLLPDDGAIKIFGNRRATPRLAYLARETPRHVTDAALIEHPAEPIYVHGMHALLLRFESTDESRPLRARQVPKEFITWFQPELGGWMSVHSCADYGAARLIAESLLERRGS